MRKGRAKWRQLAHYLTRSEDLHKPNGVEKHICVQRTGRKAAITSHLKWCMYHLWRQLLCLRVGEITYASSAFRCWFNSIKEWLESLICLEICSFQGDFVPKRYVLGMVFDVVGIEHGVAKFLFLFEQAREVTRIFGFENRAWTIVDNCRT